MSEKIKKPTIKDVAALANVSVASVSRFLNNNHGHLSREKARIIEQAVAMLNYVPSTAARAMRTKRSYMIAVVMANIDDYFATEVFKGASNILKASGYQAFLLDTGADQNQENCLLRKIRDQSFDGLLFQPLGSNVDTVSDEILHDLPTIIIDRKLSTKRWVQVISNNYEAAKKATTYFVNTMGCTNILILSSKISVASTRKERYEGILTIAKKGHVKVIEISEATYNFDKIEKEITDYLKKNKKKNRKTLIFCLKERWLIEFIPTLISKGYIKDDSVYVTGFADTDISHTLLPNSRLIHQAPYKMGAIAAELLLRELNNADYKNDNIINTINVKF